MKQALNKKTVSILMSTIFRNSCILAASSLITSTVYAQVGEKTIVTNIPITFKNEVEFPSVFNIEGTNKLVIDFQSKNDNEAIISESLDNNPLVSKINIKKVGKITRIVLDLKSPTKYNLIKKDNVYNLELKKSNKFEADSNVLNSSINKNEIKPLILINDVDKSKISLTNEEKQRIIEKVKTTINKDNNQENVVTYKNVIPLSNMNIMELQKINIKKTDGKSAKITIDFNDSSFTPSITKVEDNLIIDLKDVAIPPELQKSISTKNLGTVLQNVDIATQKGSGRLVLSQKDGWSHSIYQTDKRLVIEIKSSQEKVVEKTYKGKPLSFNFQNMEVRAILQSIADFTTLNIMASDSIQGSMSIRLTNVPWDQALDLVLESRNLQKIQEGNVIWIATRQEVADKNKSDLELLTQKSELSPLKLEFFQLNHYKAQDLKEVLEGKSSGAGTQSNSGNSSSNTKTFISKRGSVGLDIRNNTIFVQDTEDNLNEIRKIVSRLDIASRQVLIEAKLVIATDKFGKDLGARFGIGGNKSKGNTTVGIGNAYNATNPIYAIGANQPYSANGIANALSPNGLNAFNSPVVGGGALGFTILNALSGNYLSLELSALEQNNLGKVISNPRLLTADNKKATIKQGTQIPYTIPGTANSAPTVNFKDALLSLGVTPQVSPNGRIVLNLDISKDTVGQMISLPGGGQVPSIETRSITTEVTVTDGQTVVLGGVYEVSSANDVSKVPFFGDLPFLGNLFKNTSKSNEKAELLIFITPHIVNDEDLDTINNQQGKVLEEINLSK